MAEKTVGWGWGRWVGGKYDISISCPNKYVLSTLTLPLFLVKRKKMFLLCVQS